MALTHGRVVRVLAVLIGLAVSAGCAGSEEPPLAPSPLASLNAVPPLPEAPIPTPGARIRVVNVGPRLIPWLSLAFPQEAVRIGNMPGNTVSEYVHTVHGAYEGQVFTFAAADDMVFGPYLPGQSDRRPPAPLAGYAFTYYVQLVVDEGPFGTELPSVRIARITRDE